MGIKRFGVSLEDFLLESLDQYVIEKNVAEKKWLCDHLVAGTIIIMYDQAKKEIFSKINLIEQAYKEVILSSSQYYINQNFCLRIVTVMGVAHTLTELADQLTAIKGIKHGKLVMSRAD